MNSQPEGELQANDGLSESDAVQSLLQMGADQANPEDEDEEEQPGAEESDQPAIEGEEAAEAEPAPKRKLKVGDQELDEDEVIAGYLKDGDYRKKTTAIAEKERAVQAQHEFIQRELASRVQQMDAALGLLHRELIGDQQELAALLESNPHEYLKRQQQLQNKQQAFAQAVQQRQAYDQIQQQQAERQQADYLASQRSLIAERLPAWKDPAKAAAEQREIADFLVAEGYQRDELSELQDARALLLARKAWLYDKSQRLAAKKSAPAQPAPIKAGAAPANPSNERAERDLQARLRKSGRDEDAIALLLHRNKR